MRKIFIAVFACVALASCASPIKQLTADCNIPPEELLKSATTLVMQEGLNIKQSDSKLGFMQAETTTERDIWTGMFTQKVWTFQINGNKLVAMAKTINHTQNAFGATVGTAEVYYDDGVHSEHNWYWNVRNGLEKICGSKVVFIEKK